jgi:plastocyanin
MKSILASCRLLIIPAVLIFLSVSCSSNGTSTGPEDTTKPGPNEIWMKNTRFVPEQLNIIPGMDVVWINKDTVNHTLISGTYGSVTPDFRSGSISPGASFHVTFDSPGTFSFYSMSHPLEMTGVIVVIDDTGSQ